MRPRRRQYGSFLLIVLELYRKQCLNSCCCHLIVLPCVFCQQTIPQDGKAKAEFQILFCFYKLSRKETKTPRWHKYPDPSIVAEAPLASIAASRLPECDAPSLARQDFVVFQTSLQIIKFHHLGLGLMMGSHVRVSPEMIGVLPGTLEDIRSCPLGILVLSYLCLLLNLQVLSTLDRVYLFVVFVFWGFFYQIHLSTLTSLPTPATWKHPHCLMLTAPT